MITAVEKFIGNAVLHSVEKTVLQRLKDHMPSFLWANDHNAKTLDARDTKSVKGVEKNTSFVRKNVKFVAKIIVLLILASLTLAFLKPLIIVFLAYAMYCQLQKLEKMVYGE